jgi:phage terminase large subunit
LVRALERRRLILCAREFQNSIGESVYRLLCDQIERLGLSHLFEVQATTIIAANGSELIFAGVRNNPSKIKSTEGVSICFVEEAERISNASWEILIPTIRAAGSEIWLAFNPDLPEDPTFENFVTHPPDSAIVLKTSWRDNPWFPDVLAAERDYLARVDADAHAHVWEGECRSHSDAQILKGKVTVEAFDPQPDWDGPYFGLDFGFSQDPTAAVRCYVADRVLYISHEAWGLGVDIDRTPVLLDGLGIDVRRHTMRADCSRPESISFLARHGYPNVIAAPKWSGSVEDGVAHLRSYEKITIHPRCAHVIEEARLYSYKVDRLSGDVMPDIVDKHNHTMDAVRYALAPLIQARGAGVLAYYESQLVKDKAAASAASPVLWPVPSRTLAERAKREGAVVADMTSPWHQP